VSEHFVVDATIQMYPINGGGRKTPEISTETSHHHDGDKKAQQNKKTNWA